MVTGLGSTDAIQLECKGAVQADVDGERGTLLQETTVGGLHKRARCCTARKSQSEQTGSSMLKCSARQHSCSRQSASKAAQSEELQQGLPKVLSGSHSLVMLCQRVGFRGAVPHRVPTDFSASEEQCLAQGCQQWTLARFCCISNMTSKSALNQLVRARLQSASWHRWGLEASYRRVLLQDGQSCGHLTATQLNKRALVLPVDKCLEQARRQLN